MHSNSYSVKLDIFEGPMDLLTYLVRKNDLDVYNIPISFITEEYLSYIELMDALDIDYAAEFLYMAATLAHIKSKLLLPVEESDDDDVEDPRLELARPLAEYIQLKQAADHLTSRELLDQDTFTRKDPADRTDKSQYIHIGIYELIETFKEIMANSYEDHYIDFTANTLSIKDKINEIVLLLEKKNPLTFTDLIGDSFSKSNIIIAFLALLEMLKLTIIEIRQHIQSGTIRVFYL